MAEAVVHTALGTVAVDLESGASEAVDVPAPVPHDAETGLPLVVAADRCGARVVAVVERRPPLVLSDDAGTTWREAGGGLPGGVDVAIAADHPDHILFLTPSRLYVSLSGGLYWRRVDVELLDARAVAWGE